ncbi:MAG TPA: NAD-dependent epimerase/dehydratase family protein [Gemmataceae bacterium]|nr:NAD-dependent epimerase/dehydratase family protein [Gemmataceae bacterium]
MSEPGTIRTEAELDDRLSEPTPEVVATLGRLAGDIIVLGIAGKMGPTLARMARRASDAAGVRRRVIGVARFSAGGESELRADGIEPIRGDLLDAAAVARLPDAANVVFLAGRKFGSTGDEAATWATNAYLPGLVCERYRQSRIVALSTGNVYGLVPVAGGGSREDDPPRPVGEYAMSCLGRERVFEHFSRQSGTPVALVRLNYACDLRYGVLVDLARKVWGGEAIGLGMGYFNTIWQGDANAMVLRAFDRTASPPFAVNVTGPEVLSVRDVAERFGRLMNRSARFSGKEADTALLSDARRGLGMLGAPRVTADRLIEWVSDWVMRGGRSLDKPTHFESRDGRF